MTTESAPERRFVTLAELRVIFERMNGIDSCAAFEDAINTIDCLQERQCNQPNSPSGDWRLTPMGPTSVDLSHDAQSADASATGMMESLADGGSAASRPITKASQNTSDAPPPLLEAARKAWAELADAVINTDGVPCAYPSEWPYTVLALQVKKILALDVVGEMQRLAEGKRTYKQWHSEYIYKLAAENARANKAQAALSLARQERDELRCGVLTPENTPNLTVMGLSWAELQRRIDAYEAKGFDNTEGRLCLKIAAITTERDEAVALLSAIEPYAHRLPPGLENMSRAFLARAKAEQTVGQGAGDSRLPQKEPPYSAPAPSPSNPTTQLAAAIERFINASRDTCDLTVASGWGSYVKAALYLLAAAQAAEVELREERAHSDRIRACIASVEDHELYIPHNRAIDAQTWCKAHDQRRAAGKKGTNTDGR